MSFTLVTHDGIERENRKKFIEAFLRVKDYLAAGWRAVGIRNDETKEFVFVGSSKPSGVPHALVWQQVKAYQNVRIGDRWMLARTGKLPPILAVVIKTVAAAPPSDLEGEAWFEADIYQTDGTTLLAERALVPNAAIWMSEEGYQMHIKQGTDPSKSTSETDATQKMKAAPTLKPGQG